MVLTVGVTPTWCAEVNLASDPDAVRNHAEQSFEQFTQRDDHGGLTMSSPGSPRDGQSYRGYSPDQYVIGIGQGDLTKGPIVCQRVSELSARTDLAKQIRIFVKEHMVDRIRERSGKDADQARRRAVSSTSNTRFASACPRTSSKKTSARARSSGNRRSFGAYHLVEFSLIDESVGKTAQLAFAVDHHHFAVSVAAQHGRVVDQPAREHVALAIARGGVQRAESVGGEGGSQHVARDAGQPLGGAAHALVVAQTARIHDGRHRIEQRGQDRA